METKSKISKIPKLLIIGYDHHYLKSMKRTMSQFVCKVEILNFVKNVEILQDNEFEKTFKRIKDTVEKDKYDKIVFDITNLSLQDYTKTKKVISYLESTGKDLLLIANGDLYKFRDIFGQACVNKAMAKQNIVFSGTDYTIRERIKQILSF